MVKPRKKYDKEFKLMAVELIESHKTVPEVSKDLGVSKALLYQWRKSYLKKGQYSFSGNGKKSLTPEEAEIERLKKELREVEIERDILKKAVGIFSKSDGKSSNL
jgi:transposase